MRRLATFGLTAFLALAMSSAAHAALIAQFTGTTPSGSNTSYNYNLVFSTQGGDRLEAGNGTIAPGAVGSADFITLYDVGLNSPSPAGNFVMATAGPGFDLTLQNAGINAGQTQPLDDPTLTNVTYRYTGPTLITDTVIPGFSIVVNNNDGTVLRQFTGQFTDNIGPELGTKVSEIGRVAVPAAVSIPEPASVMMGLMGALGLVARRRRSL